ncbi:MAG: hypothetical protein HYZ23_00185 [Chloroflexi bacterium]|nr:hypothetical protein [Chloroflexota bacterium]
MKITKESAKAWKAAYDLDNEWERGELKARLANETVEESVRKYFAICQLATSLAGSTAVPPELEESWEQFHLEMEQKWKRLAERLKNVQQP